VAYIGGKFRAKWLYQFLNHSRFDGLDYIEPFLGMANVLMNIRNKASYTASDNQPMLINLLQNIQIGICHDYPFITKEEYNELKEDPYNDYNKASFAAYTYSRLGKNGDSYNDGRFLANINFYKRLQKSPSFKEAKITLKDYKDYSNERHALIYCDPPYENANYYKKSFCHKEFWQWVREMSKNNFVFVSEYKAPDDMINIYQKQQLVHFMHNKGQLRLEKVFVCNNELINLFYKQVTYYKDYSFPSQLELTI
jgi:site-specific DNA-adenine methylase